MKKIYVDFDSTIVNNIKAIVSLYDEDFKYYKKFEYIHWTDIRTWNFSECNCAKTEYIKTYFNQQRFFDRLEFMDNAQEVLNRLKENYEIVIVSMGTHPNLIAKKIWIKENMPYAKFVGVNIKKYPDKSHIDMADGIVFIDDQNKMLNTNARHNICFGDLYEWNENWKGKRCYNWIEIEKYLEEVMLYNDKSYVSKRIIK